MSDTSFSFLATRNWEFAAYVSCKHDTLPLVVLTILPRLICLGPGFPQPPTRPGKANATTHASVEWDIEYLSSQVWRWDTEQDMEHPSIPHPSLETPWLSEKASQSMHIPLPRVEFQRIPYPTLGYGWHTLRFISHFQTWVWDTWASTLDL